jgi:hypothetical protein
MVSCAKANASAANKTKSSDAIIACIGSTDGSTLPQSEKVSLDAFEVRFRDPATRSRAESKLAIFISFYDLRLMIRNLLSLVINDTFCFTYKGIGCVKFQYRKKSQPTVSFAEGDHSGTRS